MDRAVLIRRITGIIGDLNRLTNTLYSLSMTDIQRYPGNYEVLSLDAAHRAEVIACRMRNLVYLSTSVTKTEYLQSAAEAMEIEITLRDGVIEIVLPCLLPKKKRSENCDFLTAPLAAAMEAFAARNPMPRMNHCVICFSHIYSREDPERRVRDYDNIEVKKLLDIAAAYLLSDDSGLLCDAYNTTELGDADRTVISIMDCERFPRWLEERQTVLESIVDL